MSRFNQTTAMVFYSQCGQDAYLDQHVFRGFRGGFFVDVGAHDGQSGNNTKYFEEQYNWTGINCEPNPSVYSKLCQIRPKCINLNYAIDANEGHADFILNHGYTEMLSGLQKHYDTRHVDRLQRELVEHKGDSQIIKVLAKRLESVCEQYDVKHIHYLSIDVEGAELAVIKSINFDHVFIDIIGFEDNYSDRSAPIVEYLEKKGYVKLSKQGFDIIMIHNNSSFNLNKNN